MPTLTASATYTVLAEATTTASTSALVQPPVAGSIGGAKGRLEHPTLGVFDYAVPPDEVVDLDGGPLTRPMWSFGTTLTGASGALWAGALEDAVVVERWKNGEVGAPIEQLRQLWAFYSNPPDPSTDSVIWTPSYMGSTTRYRVALVGVRAGGDRYTLNLRLLQYGFAPQPVELELRVLGLAD